MIVLIPARGGSKGIPNKNIMSISGKPLIAYSINVAKQVTNQVYVTTDDEKIAEISREYGAFIIKRPSELAGDDAPMYPTLKHAVLELESKSVDVNPVIYIQPTSPIRSKEDIENSLRVFNKGRYDMICSMAEMPHPIEWVFKIDKEGLISPLIKKDFLMRRQDGKKLYYPNGSIYIMSPDYIKTTNKTIGGKCGAYIMSQNKSLQIDTPLEAEIIEFLIKKDALS